jgi:LPXTG-motif cell wall-anchored protein
VVGGVVGVALIAGAALFFVRRKRKQSNGTAVNAHSAQEMPTQAHEKHEMPGTPGLGTSIPQGGNVEYAKHAHDSATPQYEMPSNEVRHELA